jgi:hypothetical protein
LEAGSFKMIGSAQCHSGSAITNRIAFGRDICHATGPAAKHVLRTRRLYTNKRR